MKSARRKQESSSRIIAHGRAADNSSEFHETFSEQYLQRYTNLFQALAQPVQHVALLNSLTDVNDCDEMGLESFFRLGPISCMRFPHAAASYPPPPQCPYTQLKQFYWLDFASVLPSLLLAVQPHHIVLDMCAAPGGKSLALAQQLLKGSSTAAAAVAEQQQPGGGLTADLLQQLAIQDQQQEQGQREAQQDQQQQQHQEQHEQQGGQQQQEQQENQPDGSSSVTGSSSSSGGDGDAPASPKASTGSSKSSAGRLVCNELDPVRRSRLSGVLAAYLPGSLRRRVRVTGHDAGKHWSTFEAAMYDRVLLDAPCSSERHVVQQAIEAGGVVSAGSWSVQHCKQLAALQLRLLLAGLRALKPGGRLVYSTCSLADVENDQVVDKAVQEGNAAVSGVRVVPVDDWGLGSEVEELVGGDRTEHGLICLPDKQGWGPIYLAMLEKKSAATK